MGIFEKKSRVSCLKKMMATFQKKVTGTVKKGELFQNSGDNCLYIKALETVLKKKKELF